MLKVEITADKAIAKLDHLPESVHASLLKKVYQLTLMLENWVKTQKLAGQVLNKKSGRLVRSIGSKVEATPTAITGIVFQSADVPYGRIHEFGGSIPAHVIIPKKAQVLAWSMAGGTGNKRFAKSVQHPGAVLPSRSFMRSSLRDKSVEISMGLKQAVVEGIQNA